MWEWINTACYYLTLVILLALGVKLYRKQKKGKKGWQRKCITTGWWMFFLTVFTCANYMLYHLIRSRL